MINYKMNLLNEERKCSYLEFQNATVSYFLNRTLSMPLCSYEKKTDSESLQRSKELLTS